jgi:hypothetical protein
MKKISILIALISCLAGLLTGCGGESSSVGNTNPQSDPLDNWHVRHIFQQSGKSDYLFGVAYGNGMFVAVGEPGRIFTSADGIKWISRNSGTNVVLRRVSYGNGVFVVVGDSGVILTSSDGISWSLRISGTSNDLLVLTYGNGIFITYGSNTTNTPSALLTSADGINWTRSDSDNIGLSDLTYGNGIFVGVSGERTVSISSDGIAWASTPVSQVLTGVAYSNGTFVAVANNSVIMSSTDGINWRTSRTSSGNDALFATTSGNGIFMAVGFGSITPGQSYGVILTSPDGITWTSRNSGLSDIFSGVAYGDGTFIVVGSSCVIIQSASVL